MELAAQGRDSTFTFRRALLKKAILEEKRAKCSRMIINSCMLQSSILVVPNPRGAGKSPPQERGVKGGGAPLEI